MTPWSIPWNSPGQNTGVGSLSLLQGIFPTQGSNPGHPHCMQILYQLSHKGCPRILEWEAYAFSSMFSAHCEHLVKLVHFLPPSHLSQKCFTWGIREPPSGLLEMTARTGCTPIPPLCPTMLASRSRGTASGSWPLPQCWGRNITALVPTRSQNPPSSKRIGVMEQGGQKGLLEFPQADEVGVEAHTILRAVPRVLPRFWPRPQHTSPLPCTVQRGSGPARLSSAAPTHPNPWCSSPQVWP